MDTFVVLALLCLCGVIVERKKVSVPHLAKEWGVSTAKIIAFIKSGELRAIDVSTKQDKRPRYLIDRTDIEAFEQARSVVPDGGLSATTKLRRHAAKNVKEFF
jgi:hypothetical protein